MGNQKVKAVETHFDIRQFEREDRIVFAPECELTFHHYQIFQDKMEGLKLWEGAIVMVRYLLANSEKYESKSLLDVGAGMGVVGISAAAFLDADVLMLDYLEPVIELCQKNIEVNQEAFIEDRIPKVQFLDWNRPDNFDFDQHYDLIVGCELVYSITHSEHLVNFLAKTLKPNSELLLMIPTCRAYGPEFMEALHRISKDLRIEEEILDDEYFTKSPVPPGVKDEFYPLQELTFKLILVKRLDPAAPPKQNSESPEEPRTAEDPNPAEDLPAGQQSAPTLEQQ
jgi:predicted nicotinamide N-methyase